MLPEFSIIICTYNRAELLALTLPTLAAATAPGLPWELLLIDNNSSDNTAEVFAQFLRAHPSIEGRYFREATQGLSHARNRGYREAGGAWLFYLDDDAKSDTNLLVRIEALIQQNAFPIVGGVYQPWYHYGRPRWYRDAYASNALPYARLTPIEHPQYASGGVLLLRREVLEATGGFDPAVGMRGKTIAYGEETYLQAAARTRGFKVAYDPELRIMHVVSAVKLSPDWFFRSAFARGRDAVRGGAVGTSTQAIVGQLCIGAGVLIKDFFRHTPRLLGRGYYLENWLIDVFQKAAKRIGSIYTALLWNR